MTSHAEEQDGGGARGSALALIPAKPDAEQPILTGITPEDNARVKAYVARASAASTVRAYRSDWRLSPTGARRAATARSPRHPR